MSEDRRRIVFFGATQLGYQCCAKLLEIEQDIVGIVSISREFRISYSDALVCNATYQTFETLADRYGIPLVEVADGIDTQECHDLLDAWRPDLGVVVGWYYLIPARIRSLFPLGVVGIHASLLPKYRGGAPLVWAIINGESRTGVTLFHLNDGVDTGDIIAQEGFPIAADDTIKTVYEKASSASVQLIERYVPMICVGDAPRIRQDHRQATFFPQRSPSDGLIDWSKAPVEICNFVRAQTKPYPGAFTYINGKKVILWDADISYASNESAVDRRQ